MKKILLLPLICLIFGLPANAGEIKYDVAVIGGGCGGCAAALQAARLGASVIVLEETEMLGGQMTSAAVSTMDDRGLTRTGIYKEFLDEIRAYYKTAGKNTGCCYWGSDTIAFEPLRGAKILRKMLADAGVNVIHGVRPVSASAKKGTVVSAEFETAEKEKIMVEAKIFIDATECGDFIPLTPAHWRAGNSLSPKIDKNGIIQDITWVAVVKKYPDGVPEKLKLKTMPPNYVEYIDEYRAIVTKNGNKWPQGYPYNTATHNEYRAIPDLSNSLNVDGGDPETWENVTKTCLNWANDYPGGTYGAKKEHLSSAYLTDAKYREKTNLRAIEKTLGFIYYMQKELGMTDWSVSDEGYKTQLADWEKDEKLTPYAEILRHFPCRPYVRESRRLAGVKTMTVKDVIRDPQLKRTLKNKPDSIALGEYPIDLHGATDDRYLEADLGETKESIPNDWQYIKGGLFQIPAGALIPEKINGLLAAEKNISVSRTVNGATRLQPVTMLTGQAAGALAALAVKHKTDPRKVPVEELQKELIKAGDKLSLSLYGFSDIKSETERRWAEYAIVRGLLEPEMEKHFGSDGQIVFLELCHIFEQLTGLRKKEIDREPFEPVTCGTAAEWLAKLTQGEKCAVAMQPLIHTLWQKGSEPVTKMLMAELIWKCSDLKGLKT
ncbi:MAG: FAD-dependent oxidoreductase [Synergistaceae bacterium]|nr:FAD-dependent oxidoreductase [Synergistaceae bacterium]